MNARFGYLPIHVLLRREGWQTLDGRSFRMLAVIDQWSRESVVVEVRFSLGGSSVAATLDQAAQRHPLLNAITVDHGTFACCATAGVRTSTAQANPPATRHNRRLSDSNRMTVRLSAARRLI